MKRILFITTNEGAAWGGSEILWFKVAELCAQSNMTVGIGIKAWNPLPAKIIELTKKYPITLIQKQTQQGTLSKIYNKAVPQKLRQSNLKNYQQQILAWKPDVVLVSQGYNRDGVLMMNFLRTHHIPYISLCQAAIHTAWPGTKDAEVMETAYAGALNNYFVSEANLKLTGWQIGKPLQKAQVIRNPFGVPFVNDIAYPQTDGYHLACVGRYHFDAKGQDVLLQIMSDTKWQQRDLQINFYGEGESKAQMIKLINNFNIKNVNLKGHVTTPDIWKENHALVMPSRFEGLPLSLVEAMLCSRFGIVTDVSGNKEVIQDNIDGFIAAAPQAEYLDAAMEKAWQRRHEWEQIGKQARQHIIKLVPQNPVAEFYKEILKYIN